ncbi:hypothetical protein [Amycolatopsis sp. NPDC051128]|uniref:hypothetical protein n=1 Tax=Amycolatopsis sp. NPDC051128 TaxID=3155412 RepID=UPI003422184A
MKTVVPATILAAILATVLASPAQAVTVKQVTSSCLDGGFAGRLTLRYETWGGFHHPLGAITASGPYIGDSGTQSLRISYRDGVSTHTVYSKTSSATAGEHSQTLPSRLNLPVTATAIASTKFDSGTASCVATVLLR